MIRATTPYTQSPLPAIPPNRAASTRPTVAITPASVREAPPPPNPPPGADLTLACPDACLVAPLALAQPRDRILAHLSRRPGIHMRALQRCLGMDLSTLDHHLRMLERQDRIVVRNIGHYKALYPVHGLDRRDRDILFFLGQEKTLRVLDLLTTSPGATHTQLAHALQVAPATCSFHLKKLFSAGLLDQERHGRNMRWTLHDPARVVDLIRRFPEPAREGAASDPA